MNFPDSRKGDPFFVWGCKGTLYFLISKLFCKNFSIFIFQRQSCQELCPFRHPFLKRECKGTTIFRTSKFFISPKTQKFAKETAAGS